MLNAINIKDVKLSIAELVKVLRKQEKLTQEQLAGKLGLSRITIKNLEGGNNATLDTLFKVLQYFDALGELRDYIDGQVLNKNQKSLY
jgi:transcriptional regulator with XRE-family HTH domain